MDLQFGMQLLALYKTKTNKKNKKTKLDREFLVWSSKICLVFLEFFFVFLGFEIEKHKKPCVFFGFLYLMEAKNVQKNTKTMFFVFHQKLCPKPNLKF